LSSKEEKCILQRNDNQKIPRSGKGCQHPDIRKAMISNKIQSKEELTKTY
jgi:hypothetical protein